jgi:Skp family chaperone for outer membrane proteins
MNPEEKLKRLHELENKFIGGEEINNEERKRKRKKKLNEMREKQEQRKHFTKIIDTNDDDMMMKVFDNVQEEVRLILFEKKNFSIYFSFSFILHRKN